MMYSFWQRGWIQIREIEKKGKNGLEKEYALKVRLEEIVEYFAHERQERSPVPIFAYRGRRSRYWLSTLSAPIVFEWVEER